MALLLSVSYRLLYAVCTHTIGNTEHLVSVKGMTLCAVFNHADEGGEKKGEINKIAMRHIYRSSHHLNKLAIFWFISW